MVVGNSHPVAAYAPSFCSPPSLANEFIMSTGNSGCGMLYIPIARVESIRTVRVFLAKIRSKQTKKNDFLDGSFYLETIECMKKGNTLIRIASLM